MKQSMVKVLILLSLMISAQVASANDDNNDHRSAEEHEQKEKAKARQDLSTSMRNPDKVTSNKTKHSLSSVLCPKNFLHVVTYKVTFTSLATGKTISFNSDTFSDALNTAGDVIKGGAAVSISSIDSTTGETIDSAAISGIGDWGVGNNPNNTVDPDDFNWNGWDQSI